MNFFLTSLEEIGNSRGAKLKKKCISKGDNWSIKGPTKNLYIFIAEVVLMNININIRLFDIALLSIPIHCQVSGPPQDSKYEGLELSP